MIQITVETYGVDLTPHLEKYQSEADAEWMQDTWNFGTVLKANGWKIHYMHGPIALYKGLAFNAMIFHFDTDTHLQEFVDKHEAMKKTHCFFLYQKRPEVLRYGFLSWNDILDVFHVQPEKPKLLPKPKKKVDKKNKKTKI